MYKDVMRRKEGKSVPVALVAGLLALWSGVKFVGGVAIFIKNDLTRFVNHSLGHLPFLLISVILLMYGAFCALCCFFARGAVVPRTLEGRIVTASRREFPGGVNIRMLACGRRYTLGGRDLLNQTVNPQNWVGKKARLGVGALERLLSLEIDE